MELKRIVIGAAIAAAVALGGWWLLFQLVPPARAAVQQRCVDMQHRTLWAAYVRLPEGVTAEEFEQMLVAFCDCVARKAEGHLTQRDSVAIVRNRSTPEIDGKIVAVYQQCSFGTP